MARPPLPEGQRREHYVALRLTGAEVEPVREVASAEHAGNLSDAVRALVAEALAARSNVAAETAALEIALCANHDAHPAHDYPTTDPEWTGPPAWHCPGRARAEPVSR